MSFDSTPKEELYRTLENAVIKKEFNIQIQGELSATFTAENIYPATFDAGEPSEIDGLVTGLSMSLL